MDKSKVKEELIEEFDFQKVHNVMELLNWGWAFSKHSVPTVGEMVVLAMQLIDEMFEKDTTSISTGGFSVENLGGAYKLKFILEEVYVAKEEDDNQLDLFDEKGENNG